MENNIDILNELKDLSPTLAAISKVNVFTVPQGYFEHLSADVLLGIKTENGFITKDAVNQQADVPAGYFDGLANSILVKIKAKDEEDASTEIRALSPMLYSIQNENVFEVPQGYFDALSNSILQNLQAEEIDVASEIQTLSPALFNIKNENVFEVPQGYFDSLTDNILQKINGVGVEDESTEIRALSPMLYSIQNENVFEVPGGYFNNLAEEVLDKVKPQTKVVKMQNRTNGFFKYAVAAVFTGVMALGVFNFTSNGTKDVELPNYVKAGLAQNSNNVNVDQELAKISSDDIAKYLEANGTDVKAALVANSVDENDLPAQDDYLIDEKALDTYLNSINLDDLKN